MQLYFQNNFIKLSYNRKQRLGIAQWNGYLHGAELREAYLLCHEMINRFSLVRWLADDRLMGPILPEDVAWSLQVHVPVMAQSSLLRLARLPSHYDENLKAVGELIDKGRTYTSNLVVRDFESEEAAMAWLMQPF